MKLIVTGASGFLGGHAVRAARAAGHEVVAVGRRREALAEALPEGGGVAARALDLHADPAAAAAALGDADALLHFAWPGLPDFRSPEHVTRHLPADAAFLSAVIGGGRVRRILVAGTCLEYGLASGPLAEDQPADPMLAYPIAKDALRRLLTIECARAGAGFAWARLFYMFGPGQAAKSLLAQLDAAIDAGDAAFPMSEGEQLRDYLPAERIGAIFTALAEGSATGIVNIGSGRPVSVRALVERRLAERGAQLRLDRGRFGYPDYEAMAFWADATRLRALVGAAALDG